MSRYYREWTRETQAEFERLLERYKGGLKSLKDYLKQKAEEGSLMILDDNNPASVLEQPYNLGIVVRGPKPPIRLGDPSENYSLSERNIKIAKQAGYTFMQLLELGYLHLSPGTGNWTLAGELTDMSDCYDIKKDNNLRRVIEERERKEAVDFWQDLIGSRHTSRTLSPFFIEGMFGEQRSLEEAAQGLELCVRNKFRELNKQF